MMTAKETLEEALISADTSSFKWGHYFLIEMAMEEYAKDYHKEKIENRIRQLKEEHIHVTNMTWVRQTNGLTQRESAERCEILIKELETILNHSEDGNRKTKSD